MVTLWLCGRRRCCLFSPPLSSLTAPGYIHLPELITAAVRGLIKEQQNCGSREHDCTGHGTWGAAQQAQGNTQAQTPSSHAGKGPQPAVQWPGREMHFNTFEVFCPAMKCSRALQSQQPALTSHSCCLKCRPVGSAPIAGDLSVTAVTPLLPRADRPAPHCSCLLAP